MGKSDFCGEGVTYLGNPISPATLRKASRMRARYVRKYGYREDRVYPLAGAPTPIIGPVFGAKSIVVQEGGEAIDAARGIVIGTIRMGYGHYRIGMAVASAANAMGRIPYWFDLLSFASPGAEMIRDLDYWYSLGSRLSQKSKLFNKLVWDPLMGSAYRRLEKNYPIREVCTVFADVYRGLPAGIPLLGTHPWCAHGAVHAGLPHVVNMIPDNWPLGFHPADGALNTVQSPSSYFRFRTMMGMGPGGGAGMPMPAESLKLTAHYIDHELVANVEEDCTARINRIEKGKPRRLLISIGGAGAQQDLLTGVVRHLLPHIQDGRVVLFINFGDHRKVYEHFLAALPELHGLMRMHADWDDTSAFAGAAVAGEVSGIHGFLHADTFAAVYATNLLMRCSDLLLTKPSELAFYPIPKLLLERVGGHEAWGAVRASELGDGTVECAGRGAAEAALDRLMLDDDLLTMYCEQIPRLKAHGVYNGAYQVVELALAQAG